MFLRATCSKLTNMFSKSTFPYTQLYLYSNQTMVFHKKIVFQILEGKPDALTIKTTE